ncbi:DNA adenine methylase [Sphingomonas vulcanisoli]|uniref:site-specific DNA-methyltransferase (adenine-specific) n=1 Tax=Sphingomonas vulcanisoli TaxID=1658060 RepID=A0ABX0TP06_9SPHN|nr:DNA adenine methylase [Sphingomonas vulcanisoli]NIJ07261.1 DNA adenine methylase [Sphingomonas vulcanisoli]
MATLTNVVSETFTPVAPCRTPAPYLGGKRNLQKRICARLREIPHHTYVEPCVGMGGIFFKRDWRSRSEVINDLSGDVANLFRILQRHYEAIMGELKWKLTSRADFDRLRDEDPRNLTDIERAVRFLYLQRLSFGGKVRGRNFGVDRRTPARFDVTKLAPMLAEIHERLAPVTIEQLSYDRVIRKYDSAETLFYIDPPYVNCEQDYGDGFAPEDFFRMADQLAAISGAFMVSINDAPLARKAFGRFQIEEVDVTYTVGTATIGAGKKARELIISNRPAGLG